MHQGLQCHLQVLRKGGVESRMSEREASDGEEDLVGSIIPPELENTLATIPLIYISVSGTNKGHYFGEFQVN